MHIGEDRLKKVQLYIKIIINFIIFFVGLFGAFILVPKLLRYFSPFVIGWIIAMIANPLVRFMEKRIKIVRKHSSAIIIILVILAVVGALYGITYFVITQISSLMYDLPNMLESAQILLENASQRLTTFYNVLPTSVQAFIDGSAKSIQETLKGFVASGGASNLGNAAGAMAKNVIEFALMTMIALLSAYFFIKERDNLAETFRKTLPDSVMNNYNIIVDNFKIAVGGYFKAQFKIMAILIVILCIGLQLMRVDYALLFAIIIAVVDFLPFFGAGAVLWPWAVIELFASNVKRAICLLVIYLVCQIVRQVLQPKMVGDSIGISPFATLFFMFLGYRLYGALGMILGVPIGMVIVKFYQLGMFDSLIRGLKVLLHDFNEFRKF